LVKVYRAIQLWDQWLQHFLGKTLLGAEQRALFSFLSNNFGKHTVIIGVPEQHRFLKPGKMTSQYVLGPLINKDRSVPYIESDLHELPIQSGSVDNVILPHTLEYTDNPHQLLSEACRIVKPEGYLFILGFNPYSFWGLKKKWMHSKMQPWSGHFIPSAKINNWLLLADFELIKQTKIFFRPPMQNQNLFHRLKFLEWIGSKCFKPFGGVYLLQAKAKVVPLTPIRLHWKQELSGTTVATKFIPGSSIRNSP